MIPVNRISTKGTDSNKKLDPEDAKKEVIEIFINENNEDNFNRLTYFRLIYTNYFLIYVTKLQIKLDYQHIKLLTTIF